MNEIKIKVKFKKGLCYSQGIKLVQNDYNSTKLVFEFDDNEGTKIFELRDSDDNVILADEIVNNELILARFDEHDNAYPIFTKEGEYVYEVSLYKDNSKLTSASDKFKVNAEQVIIDGEIIETYTPMFDNLLSDLSSALQEADNIDIDVEKIGNTATVSITKKDGTNKSVQIIDGLKGDKGADAKINGVNTITIEAGDNITLDQEGNTLTISSTGGGGGGTSNYNALTNKPKINNVELNGNKTLNDLGIQPIGNYALESDMIEAQNDIDHLSKVSNLFEKITGTGTSVTLNDTSNTIMKLNLDTTTSSQVTTTGKNLFNNTNSSSSQNGITYTKNSDGTITANGTAVSTSYYNFSTQTLQAGTYMFSGCPSGGSVSTSYKIVAEFDGRSAVDIGNGKSFTLNEETTLNPVYIEIRSGVQVNNLVFKPMIETGSTKTDFEPYTGGQPAPSPSYPQTIHTINGDNTITISNSNNTKSQTYSVNLGNVELCKIGDYQDILFKNTINSPYYNVNLQLNKWYKYNNIGKTVLNGSENWNQWGTDTFYITKLSSVRTGLSNYFKYNSTVTGASQLNNGEFFIHDNIHHNVVIFKNTSYTTVADFKTWLSTHNTTVYYVLATPTYTLLNDTLQTQLDNLQYALAYDTQTNISQTNNDLPFIINAETYVDLTDYVKNTDYATRLVGGVIKVDNYYDVSLDSGGALRSNSVSYNDYLTENNNIFISKGTLENVITGKNFVTNTVNDLVNYYKKTETFTKQEVNNLISAITTMDIQVVQTLPVQDISTTTIYLVPKTTTEQNDAYDEYIYVSNNWEHIGSTEVDLTDYATKTYVNNLFNSIVDGDEVSY